MGRLGGSAMQIEYTEDSIEEMGQHPIHLGRLRHSAPILRMPQSMARRGATGDFVRFHCDCC